jgi:hypothetical protein
MKAYTLNVPESEVNEVLRYIHYILNYANGYSFKIKGNSITVKCTGKQGLRYLVVNLNGEDIKFIQQGTQSNSNYSLTVKRGHPITWGVREGGYIYITDKTIKK